MMTDDPGKMATDQTGLAQKTPRSEDGDPRWGSQSVNLTIAHLRIALLGGNPEVGNSEYINHQNCPPQLT